MKAVLISIQRPHTDNIKALIKKIEIRKNKPNQETPCPCFIYETKTKGGCGKIIGEFLCDKIDEYECEFVDDDCLETVYLIDREDCDDEDYPYRTLIWSNEGDNYNFSPDNEIIKGSRVSYKELKKYIGYGFNTFYGWHISDLKIYDKPKELGNFFTPMGKRPSYMIERPPQSWRYVEEL